MFKIVSIESEKVSNISMIPAPVVEFFNRYYGVDVSNVEIVYEDMDNNAGYYNTLKPNVIHISNSVKDRGLATESIIAHELNHLVQYEYGKSLTITKEYILDKYPSTRSISKYIHIADIDALEFGPNYADEQYWNLHVEIDSRLTEALYLYTQAGRDGLEVIMDHVFKCGLTNNLLDRIDGMPDSMAKIIIMNEFIRREQCIERVV